MEDRALPLGDHLQELRVRLRNAVIAIAAGCAIAYYWAEVLFALLAKPLAEAWKHNGMANPSFKFGSLVEPFWVYFELSLYAGVFIASPVVFHQIWRFIAPGLYQKERRIAVPFALSSALFFIGGALFCYTFVLPAMFRFLLSYSSANIGQMRDALGVLDIKVTDGIAVEPNLFMQQYLDLATRLLLAFGLVFEMPLAIFFLSFVGLVNHRMLWRFNKYWAVLSFIIGGLLTPGPDIVSQLFMATPLIVLYNLSILISFVVTRRRDKAQASAAT